MSRNVLHVRTMRMPTNRRRGAASRMAAKIMEQYSISQADIMVNENIEQRQKRGGMSTVDIRPAKDGGRAFTPGWGG